jgi:hypothetical protein
MIRLLHLCLLTMLLMLHDMVIAQQLFSEGIIEYAVVIDPPANQEGITQYSGTYVITIKGRQVKKELKLENGFSTVMLFNYKDSSGYSLRKIGDRSLAIQLDIEQINERRKKYEGLLLKENNGKKEIAGIQALAGTVTYPNSTSTDIYYSKDWYLNDAVFDRFPGAKFMPLIFKSINEDGLGTSFNIIKIAPQPVADAEFRIPTHYKMMSSAEYQKLTAK